MGSNLGAYVKNLGARLKIPPLHMTNAKGKTERKRHRLFRSIAPSHLILESVLSTRSIEYQQENHATGNRLQCK